jgi:hypothetical protein
MTTTYRPNVIDYRLPPQWLGDEVDGERVIAWRLTNKLVESTELRIIGREWRYEIITERSIYNAKIDGTMISQGSLNLV